MEYIGTLPLSKVQRYGTLNATMHLKYTTELSLVFTQDCHIWASSTCIIYYLGNIWECLYLSSKIYNDIARAESHKSLYSSVKQPPNQGGIWQLPCQMTRASGWTVSKFYCQQVTPPTCSTHTAVVSCDSQYKVHPVFSPYEGWLSCQLSL